MKVLHVIKSLGRGGAETLLQETLKQHNKTNFEFHYVFFLPWKNQLVKGLQNAGGIVQNLPAKNNLSILLQVINLSGYIKQHQIDLVHCHLPWAGFAGRLVSVIADTPVIYTEHNKQERYHFITRWLNKISFNFQHKAIAVSNDVAVSIAKNIHPSIQVQTILNGIDTDFFVRSLQKRNAIHQQYSINPGTIVIGVVTVFRSQKRLKEWVNVFESVHEKYPATHAIIVGDGILFQEVKTYIETLGLQNCISLPGLQSDVLSWYSAIDIFMMTSEFEGLPLALLEAMSCGCAVASTNAGGIKEVIRHKKDGFLVETARYFAISDLLGDLLENRELIVEYGLLARKRVVESFSIVETVKQLEQLYLSF